MVFNHVIVRNIRLNNRNTLTWIFVYVIMITQLCYIFVIKYNGPTYIVFYQHSRLDIHCYRHPESVLISTEDKQFSPRDKNIFFLETSCTGGLNSRQACSIETTARANPDWEIKVLFTGPLTTAFLKSITFQTLISIPNVQFARINITEFIKRTPLEKVEFNRILKKSIYKVIHSSDILRILTLYKYGGIYLDLDVIVMKSFNTLPCNFVVRQNKDDVASGILAFSNDETGRKFVEIAARGLNKSFNPLSWTFNGPDMILRTLVDLCDTPRLRKMSAATCNGFEVFDSKYFFPISYENYKEYFTDSVVNDSDAYAHHVWNALGRKMSIPENSLYSRLAKKYCPTMYNLYGDEFGS